MKLIQFKTILLIQLILLMSTTASWAKAPARYGGSHTSPKPAGSIKTIAIPAETVFNIALSSPLNSSHNKVGDRLSATVKEPVYVGPYLAVPIGTSLAGEIVEVNKTTKKNGPNPYVVVNFANLKRPGDKLAYPIQANLIAYKTGLKSTDYLWKLPQKNDKWKAHLSSTLGGAAVGFFINPVFGSAIGAGAGLLKSVTLSKIIEHGSIKIKAGQEIPIALEKAVMLPVLTHKTLKAAL